MPSARTLRVIKACLFAIALLPLARLVAAVVGDARGAAWAVGALTLGTNPIELLTRSTGTWTLVFLCAGLALTPLRRLTGAHWLLRLRRMVGLFAFFYAALHLTTYVWFDQWFDPQEIVKDVIKRPFITVGMAAFLLLLPLALTSTDGMMRRLGRRWGKLHQLVYPIAILGVVHYWWLVKRDVTQPLAYAAVVALLLGFRAAWRAREQQAANRS
jgi:sulfoxide reductase heme-binding subunit YedZ